MAAAAAGGKIPGRRQAARIPRVCQGKPELWREYSWVYRARDGPNSRRFSTDRSSDGPIFMLKPKPAADPARGRLSPLLYGARRPLARHRRLFADRVADTSRFF